MNNQSFQNGIFNGVFALLLLKTSLSKETVNLLKQLGLIKPEARGKKLLFSCSNVQIERDNDGGYSFNAGKIQAKVYSSAVLGVSTNGTELNMNNLLLH